VSERQRSPASQLARRHTRPPALTFFPAARARGASKTTGAVSPSSAMAADRVAETEKEPTKYWCPNLPEAISLRQLGGHRQTALAHRARLRGTEAGTRTGHYGRPHWRGFHHHATLCIAAYGFLVLERCLFPLPQARRHCGQSTSRLRPTPCANPATRLAALPGANQHG